MELYFDSYSLELLTIQLENKFFDLIEKNRLYIEKGFPKTCKLCSTFETTRGFVANAVKKIENGIEYFFVMKNNDTLIGLIHIKNIDTDILKCELGYFIDKDYNGKNITSNAVAKIIEFCKNDLEMNKVYICTSEDNYGSQKVALKNGFVKEGVLRNEFKDAEGKLQDVHYYGLTPLN